MQQLANVNLEQGTLPVETLILCVAKALVDDPQSVTVTAADDELGTTIIVTVASADLGKIIGKQGRTARSIRVVLQAASLRLGRTLFLNIQAAGESATAYVDFASTVGVHEA